MSHKSSACCIWCPLIDRVPGGLWFSWPHPCMIRTVSLFFLGHLFVLAPLTHFYDVFLLVCSSMQASHHIHTPLSQDRSLFREGVGRKNELAVLDTSALWTVSYVILSSRSLNRTESTLMKFKFMTQPSLYSESQTLQVGEKPKTAHST